MARRTRKFILDNTTGTVYTNIDNVSNATKVNISGGAVSKLLKVSIAKSGNNVYKVTSGKTAIQKKNLVITSVFLQVTDKTGKESSVAAPVGDSLTIRLRKYNTLNATTSTLGSYSITSGQTSSTNSVSFNILDTDLVFVDVTNVGSIRTGLGLNVILTYFG